MLRCRKIVVAHLMRTASTQRNGESVPTTKLVTIRENVDLETEFPDFAAVDAQNTDPTVSQKRVPQKKFHWRAKFALLTCAVFVFLQCSF